MKYKQVSDGEWVKPVMKNYKMACCDCGLVHILNFKICDDGETLLFQAMRDERKTAAKRRYLKKRK